MLPNAYDAQVVINFTTETAAPVDSDWLEQLWRQSFHKATHKKIDGILYLDKINNNETVKNCDTWFPKNAAVRIYVIFHASIGADTISISSNPNTPSLTIAKLAEVLKQIIGDHPSVAVNLIACNAGRGVKNSPHESPEKSIASKLHEQLYRQTQRDIPVIARVTTTRIYPSGAKGTRHINSGPEDKSRISKQPKSKVVFYKEGSNQVQDDAYLLAREKNLKKWQEIVLSTKDQLRNEITDNKTKQLFDDWFNHIEQLDVHELYMLLQKAKDDSEIQTDKSIHLMVDELLEQGDWLFNTDHLAKRTVKPLE